MAIGTGGAHPLKPGNHESVIHHMAEMMEEVQPLMLKDPEGVNLKIWAKIGGIHLLGQEGRIGRHLLEPEFTG